MRLRANAAWGTHSSVAHPIWCAPKARAPAIWPLRTSTRCYGAHLSKVVDAPLTVSASLTQDAQHEHPSEVQIQEPPSNNFYKQPASILKDLCIQSAVVDPQDALASVASGAQHSILTSPAAQEASHNIGLVGTEPVAAWQAAPSEPSTHSQPDRTLGVSDVSTSIFSVGTGLATPAGINGSSYDSHAHSNSQPAALLPGVKQLLVDPVAQDGHSTSQATSISAPISLPQQADTATSHQAQFSADRADGEAAEVAQPGSPMQTLITAVQQLASKLTSGQTTASTGTSEATMQAVAQDGKTQEHACAPEKVWALFILSATYVHQAASGCSIPVMLPIISESLSLTDFEGALLTTGYTCIYALALVPAGVLADRVPRRSALLGAGVASWSALALVASQAGGFAELMLARIGLAVAQSTQNVVCFSIIPDLFPKNKSTAVSLYNCAIYCGRGLMYLAFNAARLASQTPTAIDAVSQEQIVRDAVGNILVPLDKLDLRLVQIMYTSGDMAAIRASTPLYGISPELLGSASGAAAKAMADSVWRPVLETLAVPGALLAAALFFTIQEPPRGAGAQAATASTPTVSNSAASSPPTASVTPLMSVSDGCGAILAAAGATAATSTTASSGAAVAASTTLTSHLTAAAALSASPAAAPPATIDSGTPGPAATIWRLLTCAPFMVTTAGAALNDVASFAMIAWQSTFYERVYHLTIDQYAPALATLLPLSGIVGGVGGGLLADRLALKGQRAWITAATTIFSAPLIWGSLTAQSADESFLYLAIGFALSEAWRAPSAVMARSVVSPHQASTAMSLYLCIRNVVGSLGPITIAQMSQVWDLQKALELLPLMYVGSGLLFWWAEKLLAEYHAQPGIASGGAAPGAKQL